MSVAARSRRLLSTLVSDAAEPPEPSVESDLVVIIAALLCAIICLAGLAAVARCACLRHANSNSTLPKSANKGLKKKILHSFPKFVLDPTTRIGFTAEECAICLAEFADGDEIRLLPQCGHGFHVGCVDTWLGAHSSCPSCRQILVDAARCQKCEQFPAEAHRKVREDAATAASYGHDETHC